MVTLYPSKTLLSIGSTLVLYNSSYNWKINKFHAQILYIGFPLNQTKVRSSNTRSGIGRNFWVDLLKRNSPSSTNRQARSLSLYYVMNVFFNFQIFDESSNMHRYQAFLAWRNCHPLATLLNNGNVYFPSNMTWIL